MLEAKFGDDPHGVINLYSFVYKFCPPFLKSIWYGITKKVTVFGDTIIRGIRVRDFDQQVNIKNGYEKFKYFPGC